MIAKSRIEAVRDCGWSASHFRSESKDYFLAFIKMRTGLKLC